MNKQGKIVLHVSAGIILLLLIVIFITIALIEPALALSIAKNLSGLVTAFKG